MNWITRWKKIGIKVKQIFKKQPTSQESTDWKNCPQCKKISYKPDLVNNFYICDCSFHFVTRPAAYRKGTILPNLLGQAGHFEREVGASGAAGETRTPDLRFTKPLLYQLSYCGFRHHS